MINEIPSGSIRRTVREAFPDLPECSVGELPVLTLAYIGDTVYDLYVRSYLIQKLDTTAHGTHVEAARMVCAAGQASAFRKIEPLLTEEETRVFHRGRNAHSSSVPKNASVLDYRIATGLETLFGYLYWTGGDGRLNELMRVILEEMFETKKGEPGSEGSR